MSKRGLSADEKKVKMLEVFHENSEFFTIKELEKIGAKRGVVLQTIKGVVDDLVDEGSVMFDKIGTSNYFWSFPSAAGATKQSALTKAKNELDSIQVKIDETNKSIGEAKKGREDTADRRKLLTNLEALNTLSQNYKAELQAFGAADPVRYEKKAKAIEVCKEAALRWTDNTMILASIATSQGGIEPDTFRGILGISEEWEELAL